MRWSCDGKGALKVRFVVLEAFMRSRYTVLVENSDENENSWRTEICSEPVITLLVIELHEINC